MFNRSECTYWSLKCYIMLGNEFFIDFKRYWIICIHDAAFSWKVVGLCNLWTKPENIFFSFIFSFCVCKSVCLKTHELIKGFSLVWCFVCSSQMSKCEVILQLKLLQKANASFWLQRPWNLMVLQSYNEVTKVWEKI